MGSCSSCSSRVRDCRGGHRQARASERDRLDPARAHARDHHRRLGAALPRPRLPPARGNPARAAPSPRTGKAAGRCSRSSSRFPRRSCSSRTGRRLPGGGAGSSRLYIALGTVFMATQYAGQIGVHIGRHFPVTIRGKPTNDAHGGTIAASIGWLIPPVLLLFWISFVGHQVNRWRHATGIERAQLKWLMSGAAIARVVSGVAIVMLGDAANLAGRIVADVSIAGISTLAIAFGVGILRCSALRHRSADQSHPLVRDPHRSARRGVRRDRRTRDRRAAVLLAGRGRRVDARCRRAVQPSAKARTYSTSSIAASTGRATTARQSSLRSRPAWRDAIDPVPVHAELPACAADRAIQPSHASIWIRPGR